MPNAPAPVTLKTTSLMPPNVPSDSEIVSIFQPRRSMKRVYMRCKSAAKSAASSPPVPARISTMHGRSLIGSCGMRSGRAWSSSSRIVVVRRSTSLRASVAISASSDVVSSRASANSSSALRRRSASWMVVWRR